MSEPIEDVTLRHNKVLETYKSLVTLSTEGFKFLAIVNGGAVVALLAYMGNVVRKEGALPDLWAAMVCFAMGLVVCGFALLFSYLTQLSLFNTWQGLKSDTHKCWMYSGIACYVASLVLFAGGALSAASAFGQASEQLVKKSERLAEQGGNRIPPSTPPLTLERRIVPHIAAPTESSAAAGVAPPQPSPRPQHSPPVTTK